MKPHIHSRLLLSLAVASVFLAGCEGTGPKLGGGSTVATGSAGGATTDNANTQLEKCSESLGTLAVVEDQAAPWFMHLSSHKLGSTVPVLRMMIQQSNCFVVVERGRAMNNMMQERELEHSGEMRSGSNFKKGQMVAADYTVSPTINFSQKDTGGMGGALGGLGVFGAVAGVVAGGIKANEASTTLLMIDNRSGVQLAAAEGSAKNFDFNLMGGLFGGGAFGSLGGYSNTPEGKVLIAAFMDSYNQLVKATRNYRAQEVKGGLGTGGRLGVQGGQTPASKPDTAPAAGATSSGATPSGTATMSVADAQRKLAQLGYQPGPADGSAGGRTATALRAFQKDRGLNVTGRLDAATIAQLMK